MLNPCRALRPGLEKPAWVSPLDLCECALTGTLETFYNAALNSGACMVCFSVRKGGRHDYVSRGSWHDLIHGSFFYLCQGNLPLQNSEPHMVVCLILLILSLRLLLGTKCDHTARILHSSCESSSQWSGGAGSKRFVQPANNSSTRDQIWTATSQGKRFHVEMGSERNGGFCSVPHAL